ncbi:hypothetical protein [Alkalihalobacillus trypoxylicola]|uniref:Uncharacterized protein n=1 Tax=Alkalihalobacillus trypoxylicola TaxID=519424 RepID=A0A162D593_9BACI|nr:hypothetical protein [Alkalihalobacillus trypoxylicola]KYG28152.1 hypothetical protein AZF04_09620 [Alkalihalobacillus trypoxylicola]
MTEKEIEMLKADLKAEIIKDLTGKDLRVAQDKSKPLAEVYNKYKDELHKKYGNVTWGNVWECVRKLAVYRAGHRYVRDLLPSEEVEAAKFAEQILEEMLN